MDKYDAIIIGCGAAGMMAGITLAEKGKKVLILEKNEKAGKKIFITGKGRCNLTNASDNDQIFKNIVSNPKFMYSALENFSSADAMEFFSELGLKIKTERGGRVFPLSDHSSDVISVLTTKLKRLNVDILYNHEVVDIITSDYEVGNASNGENNSASASQAGDKVVFDKYASKKKKALSQSKKVNGVSVKANGKTEVINANSIIVATGGASYPRTGSTGDGYEFAKKSGHTIKEPKPALVPLETRNFDCKELMGLALKNVEVSFITKVKNKEKIVYSEFGEMLFTHFGVSGPVILSASSYLHKYDGEEIRLLIDLKPALSEKQLDDRLLRDFEENKNKQFRNAIDSLLPKRLIPVIIDRSGIDPYKKVNEISKAEREKLVKSLKAFEIEIAGYRGFDEAIITQGGVNVKEISPQTMESKLVKDLYFIGEVVDCDALTGGYNLQLAWSMGRILD